MERERIPERLQVRVVGKGVENAKQLPFFIGGAPST